MGYTNSPLATYTLLSPNHSGQRTHPIDRISIHCVVGQLNSKRGAELFQSPSRKASCNYCVGKDGDISLVVEEKNRSWCTSSRANDQRAITIETASDAKHPYAVTPKAFAALLDLCTDICRRNGKKKLLWIADKTTALNYKPAADEMVLTVHRWFANKACPGEYLFERHPAIAAEVTKRLSGSQTTTAPTSTVKPVPSTSTQPRQVKASKAPTKKDKSLAGTYVVSAKSGLNLRDGAGAENKSLVVIPPRGTKVRNYGYYSLDGDTKWLYIQVSLKGVTYTGFSSSKYLTKIT